MSVSARRCRGILDAPDASGSSCAAAKQSVLVQRVLMVMLESIIAARGVAAKALATVRPTSTQQVGNGRQRDSELGAD